MAGQKEIPKVRLGLSGTEQGRERGEIPPLRTPPSRE